MLQDLINDYSSMAISIGSGNDFGAIRQQAITWPNVYPVLCHHMASLLNRPQWVKNRLRLRRNDHHFAEDILKWYEN